MIPLRISLIAVPLPVWQAVPNDRPLAELVKDAAGAERRIRKQSNAHRELVRYTQLCTYIETVALELVRRSLEPPPSPVQAPRGVPLGGIRSIEWSDDPSNGRQASAYVRLVEGLHAWSGSNGLSHDGADPGRPAGRWSAPGRFQAIQFLLRTLRDDIHPGWMALLPRPDARAAWSRVRIAWDELRQAFRNDGASIDGDEPVGLAAIRKSVFPAGRDVVEQRKVFERLTVLVLERLFPQLSDATRMMLALLVREMVAFYREAERTNSAIVIVVSQQSVEG